MVAIQKCRICHRDESLAEPFIDGTCSECIRRTSGVQPPTPRSPRPSAITNSPPRSAPPPAPVAPPISGVASQQSILRTTPLQMVFTAAMLLGIWICAALLLAQLFSGREPSWEYKIIAPSDDVFAEVMDILGRDGWELVTARRATSGDAEHSQASYECIFRQPTRLGPASDELRSAVIEYVQIKANQDAKISLLEQQLRLVEAEKRDAAVNELVKALGERTKLVSAAAARVVEAKSKDRGQDRN